MNKAFEFVKKHWVPLVIIAVTVVVYHRWLSFSIFANGDFAFFYRETIADRLPPSAWAGSLGLGGVSSWLWRDPFYDLYGFFGRAGFDSNVGDQFLLFWPTVLSVAVGGYLLVKKITASEVAAAVGSLVFSYNTYFLAIDTQGHLLLTMAGGFSALFLWAFITTFERDNLTWAVVTSLFFSTVCVLDMRVAYLTAALAFFYLIWDAAFVVPKDSGHRRPAVTSALIVLGLTLLLNAFWLLVSARLERIAAPGDLGRGFFGDQFWNLSAALTLFHPFWNGLEPVWFKTQPIPPLFWLIPLSAFSGAWLFRKNPRATFFALLSLLGIFLTKQTEAPWGQAYSWLYQYLPGFNAFREATKFYFFIVVGYAVLIGFFIAHMWERRSLGGWRRPVAYATIAILAGIFLWNTKPLVTGEIGSMWESRTIHADYSVLRDFLRNDREYSRILVVPGFGSWVNNSHVHPLTGTDTLRSLNPAVFGNRSASGAGEGTTDANAGALHDPNLPSLLDLASVRYVIVPVVSPDGAAYFHEVFGRDRQDYVDVLDRLSFLTRKDIGTGQLTLYENDDFRPHLYLTGEPESLFSPRSYRPAEYAFIDADTYHVGLKNVAAPVYLNFSESYHPGWALKIGAGHVISAMAGRKGFLPDGFHSKSEVGLNSFLVDPSYIKSHFPADAYHVNADGSLDVDLTLYFLPQSFLILGWLVSGAVLSVCLGYLVYCGWKLRSARAAHEKI